MTIIHSKDREAVITKDAVLTLQEMPAVAIDFGCFAH